MVSLIGSLPSPTLVAQYASSSISFATFKPAIFTTIMTAPASLVSGSSTTFSSPALLATASELVSAPDGPKNPDNGECRLLGSFAILIQGALGALALLALVYKRWRERPQRPVKIWAFDVSKQVVGSVLLHIANLFMSMLSSGELSVTLSNSSNGEYQANPCSFYLLNLAIDTTIGIPILIVLLRLFTYGCSLTPLGNPPESIQSGNYGRPPKVMWWLKQSLIYFIGLLCMKICVFFIFQLCPWIVQVGDWALKWTEGNERVQEFFVMLLFPVIMNALQYYIIDGFIKDQRPSDHEPIPSEDGDADEQGNDSDTRRQGSRGQDRNIDSVMDSDDETEVDKPVESKAGTETEPKSKSSDEATKLETKIHEYNPDTDGEDTPTAGSGSNSNGDEERSLLPQESKQRTKKK